MAHDHAPGHDHSHGADADGLSRAFLWGAGLNVSFLIIEAICGFAVGSLALVADAGHNASDVLGLLLAWGAAALARGGATERRTYGLRRTTILAALLNAVLLLVAVGGIAWEAVDRLMHPHPVASGMVIWVALAGVVVNGASAWLFHGRHGDLNARGAYLHLMADAAVSLGVVGAAIAMRLTGLTWIDPAVSLVIAVVVTVGTWGLLRDALDLTLDAVPRGIDLAAVRGFLLGVPAVAGVHDLHVWGMSTSEAALTAHLVVDGGAIPDTVIGAATQGLRTRFGIAHSTLQVENGDCGSLGCCEPSAAQV
ncbi:MAG: cation diffusion facilitator family transporter [Acidobacteriota bacterium]